MGKVKFNKTSTLAQAKASTDPDKIFFPTDSSSIVMNKKEYGIEYESMLKFGGVSLTDSFSPIDAAMIGVLGANRFAGIKRGVTFERSSDNGNTYTEFAVSTKDMMNIFLGNITDKELYLKSPDADVTTSEDKLRITINTSVANVYTSLNKICMYISTNGSGDCYVLFEKAKYKSPDIFETVGKYKLGGWSGWNVLNFDRIITHGHTDEQYARLRFTFMVTNATSGIYKGMVVFNILGFGGMGWMTPSKLAKTGKLYEIIPDEDGKLNAKFPNAVEAQTFKGNVDGKATSASALSPESGTTLLKSNRILTENYEKVNAGTPTFTGTYLTGTYNINSSSLYTSLENVKNKGLRPLLEVTLHYHTTVVSIPLTREADGTYTGFMKGKNGEYFIEASISSSIQIIRTQGFGTYTMPSSGIPDSDLAQAVRSKLSKIENNTDRISTLENNMPGLRLQATWDNSAQKYIVIDTSVPITWESLLTMPIYVLLLREYSNFNIVMAVPLSVSIQTSDMNTNEFSFTRMSAYGVYQNTYDGKMYRIRGTITSINQQIAFIEERIDTVLYASIGTFN